MLTASEVFGVPIENMTRIFFQKLIFGIVYWDFGVWTGGATGHYSGGGQVVY